MSSGKKYSSLKQMCDCLNNEKLIIYNKLKTGGNDPTVTKAMQFSAYIKSSRSKNIMYTQYYQSLNI